MKIKMENLDTEIIRAKACDADIMDQSIIWRDGVFAAMNALRETVDIIETKVDEKYWPMPTYMDLLFGI